MRASDAWALACVACVAACAQLCEPATKLSGFAKLLSVTLSAAHVEPRLAEAAARALGHLVRSGGALTADVVEREARPQRSARTRTHTTQP